jgi:prepilin-type N-terminal cleavage/methylation domain-containing protein
MWNRKGFTLIELLIVIGMTAILSSVAFLNFSNYINHRKLNNATRAIASVLRQTQIRAMAQESSDAWGVHFEYPTGGSPFYQVFSGTWATGTREGRQNIPAPVIYLDPAYGTSKDIIFAKRTGGTTAATITLALNYATTTTQKTITVTAYGTIQQ